MYDAGISYVDFHIGKLMESLKESGLDENTIIIFTGDHGTGTGEHTPFFDNHGLFEEITHVPLIIKYGNRLQKKRLKFLTQHVDLVPTVLDMVGIDAKKYGLDGSSLYPSMKGTSMGIARKHSYMSSSRAERFAVFDGRYKYVYSKDEASAKCMYCKDIHEGEVEVLYDLKDDPDETKNVIEANKDVAKRLNSRLLDWLKSDA
jgi:arylsulfatase A-like enzyme